MAHGFVEAQADLLLWTQRGCVGASLTCVVQLQALRRQLGSAVLLTVSLRGLVGVLMRAGRAHRRAAGVTSSAAAVWKLLDQAG